MKFFLSNKFSVYFLVFCVVVGFLLRLNIFDATASNFYFVDVARDYIVSHHMVLYGEVPLTGPDGYGDSPVSSPMYYYVLAFFLMFNGSVFFPGLINIALQTLSILVVFLLAKEMFGRKTAFLATIFFTFFEAIIGQSFIMWQPYLMQPFLLASVYLLVVAFKKQRNSALYASTALFVFACMLHNSVLAVLPVYIFSVGLVLFNLKARLSVYGKAILSFVIPLILMLLPALIYFSFYYPETVPLSEKESLYLVPDSFFVLQFSSWSFNFIERFVFLSSFLFEGTVTSLDEFTPSSYTYLCVFGLIVGSILYILQNRAVNKVYYFLILWGTLLSSLAVVAVLGMLSEFEFPVRYFTPVYVALLILVAEIIVSSFQKYTWTIVPKVMIVIVLLMFASPLPTSIEEITKKITENGWHAFTPVYTTPEDVQVLSQVVKTMKNDTGTFPSFDVRTFKNDYEDQFMDSLIWFPLEEVLHTRFVKVSDPSFRGFAADSLPSHMFVRCLTNTKEGCTYSFLRKYNLQYQVVDVIEATPEVFYLHAIRI